jgi:hypothetical protein
MGMSSHWTEAEISLLRELARDDIPRDQLPAYFPDRKQCAVRDKFRKMFPRKVANDQRTGHVRQAGAIGQQKSDETTEQKNITRDNEFQKAMRRAMKDGLESPPMDGVYRAPDAETWFPKFFPSRVVSRSFCSSPTALCAEA